MLKYLLTFIIVSSTKLFSFSSIHCKLILNQDASDFQPVAKEILKDMFNAHRCVNLLTDKGSMRRDIMSAAYLSVSVPVYNIEVSPRSDSDTREWIDLVNEGKSENCDGYILALRDPRILAMEFGRNFFMTPGNRVIAFSDEDIENKDVSLGCPAFYETSEVITVSRQTNSSGTTFTISLPKKQDTAIGFWRKETGLVTYGSLFPRERTDLQGRPIRVSGFHCPPFVVYKDDGRSKVLKDGIETRFLYELAKWFNFTWKIVHQQNEEKWGKTLPNGSVTGVTGDLIRRTSDIGLCSLWMSLRNFMTIDMTVPWTSQCITILAPKQKTISQIEEINFSVRSSWWVHALTTMVGIFIVLWMILYLRSMMSGNQSVEGSFSAFPCMIFGNKSCNQFLKPAFQLLTACGLLLILVFLAYYTGNTSFLTLPMLSDPIRTVDFLKSNISWSGTNFEPMKYVLRAQKSGVVKFANKFQKEVGSVHRNRKAEEGNYAILVKKVGQSYLAGAEELEENSQSELALLGECISQFYVAFGLQKYSPYKRLFDGALTRFFESGITQFWERDVARNLGYHYMQEFIQSSSASRHLVAPLFINNFQGSLLRLFTEYIGTVGVIAFQDFLLCLCAALAALGLSDFFI